MWVGVWILFALGCRAPTDCKPTVQLVPDPDGTTSLVPGARPAGIDRCDGDTWNRTEAVTCATETTASACSGDGVAACDACGERERCLQDGNGCVCVEFCTSDDECGDGQACLCTASITTSSDGGFTALAGNARCVPAECRSDDDCGGASCGVVLSVGCVEPIELRCRAATDGCASNADCGDAQCLANDGGGWSCQQIPATCE